MVLAPRADATLPSALQDAVRYGAMLLTAALVDGAAWSCCTSGAAAWQIACSCVVTLAACGQDAPVKATKERRPIAAIVDFLRLMSSPFTVLRCRAGWQRPTRLGREVVDQYWYPDGLRSSHR